MVKAGITSNATMEKSSAVPSVPSVSGRTTAITSTIPSTSDPPPMVTSTPRRKRAHKDNSPADTLHIQRSCLFKDRPSALNPMRPCIIADTLSPLGREEPKFEAGFHQNKSYQSCQPFVLGAIGGYRPHQEVYAVEDFPHHRPVHFTLASDRCCCGHLVRECRVCQPIRPIVRAHI